MLDLRGSLHGSVVTCVTLVTVVFMRFTSLLLGQAITHGGVTRDHAMNRTRKVIKCGLRVYVVRHQQRAPENARFVSPLIEAGLIGAKVRTQFTECFGVSPRRSCWGGTRFTN